MYTEEPIKAIFLASASSTRELVDERVRKAVLTAYDHKCQHCPSDKQREATCVDHIIPLKLKVHDIPRIVELDIPIPTSLDVLENMVASCTPCNIRKSNRLIESERLKLLLHEAKTRVPLIEYLAGIRPVTALQKDTSPYEDSIVKSNTISFLSACIVGDAELADTRLKQGLEQDVLKRGFEVALYFGQADIVSVFPNSVQKTLAIEKFLTDSPPEIIKQEHFDMLIESGLYREGLFPDILPGSPLLHALKLADFIGKDDICSELIERLFGDVYATDCEYDLVDAIIFDDHLAASDILTSNENALGDLDVPMRCALLNLAQGGTDMQSVNLLADHGGKFSLFSYASLFASINAGCEDTVARILEERPPSHILDRALLFAIKNASCKNIDKVIDTLRASGASFDRLGTEFLDAITHLAKEAMRTYGAGYNRNPWSRLTDRDRHFKLIESIVGDEPFSGSQSVLSAVVHYSSSLQYGGNGSFRPDWYEDKLVEYLEDKGARLSALKSAGFLWSCAFGRLKSVHEYFESQEKKSSLQPSDVSRGLMFSLRNDFQDIADYLYGQDARIPRNLPAGPVRSAVAGFVASLG
jgi:5-methylcytosine-specific restriction endonuclease McrA